MLVSADKGRLREWRTIAERISSHVVKLYLESKFKSIDFEPDDYVDSYLLSLTRIADDEGMEIEPEPVAKMVVWRVRVVNAVDAWGKFI
jgi:hypothetical protein